MEAPELFEPQQSASPGLFGFHAAPLEADQLILTGRELDALAAFQENRHTRNITSCRPISAPTGHPQRPRPIRKDLHLA